VRVGVQYEIGNYAMWKMYATFYDILNVLFVVETEANMIQERDNNCDRFLESEAKFF